MENVIAHLLMLVVGIVIGGFGAWRMLKMKGKSELAVLNERLQSKDQQLQGKDQQLRELENSVEYMARMEPGEIFTLDRVPSRIKRKRPDMVSPDMSLDVLLQKYEKECKMSMEPYSLL